MALNNKVVLVTGGGRGIGKEIALTLAKEKASVIINDFFEDRAEEVKKAIRAQNLVAYSYKADITLKDEVNNMFSWIQKEIGFIDILINNAGIPAGSIEKDTSSLFKTFIDTDIYDWDKMINLSLIGAFLCCKAVIPHMINKKWGRIISIVSDAGRVGEPKQAVYSAVKAGVVGFTKALAKENARYGINVNCVSSAATDETYLLTKTGSYKPSNENQVMRREKIMKTHPLSAALNRLGTPKDIANAVLYLSSEGGDWITGQVISVNGGYCMVD